MRTPRPTGLRVAPHLEVTAFTGRGLVVTTDSSRDVFAGAAFAEVARAADGTRSERDLIDLLSATLDAADVQRAIADLRGARVLVALDDSIGDAEAAYFARDGVPLDRIGERLAATRVAVTGIDEGDVEAVRDALAATGVTVGDDESELELVIVGDYLDPPLREHNREALRTRRPWLLAGVAGVEMWIGPVFVPDGGPCWECLAQRLRRLRAQGERIASGSGSIAATRMAMAGAIAAQALRWILIGRRSGLHERVLSIDARTWRSATHTVMWRPQCPDCGVPDASAGRPAAPIALAPGGTLAGVEAGFRTVAVDETVRRHVHHVSHITGVVSRLVRPSGLRDPLHAYAAGEPPARVHGRIDDWRWSSAISASGKGTTDAQAMAGALCEAVERYSGQFFGDESRRTAAFAALGDAAVHPNACMGFSEAQYERRMRGNGVSPAAGNDVRPSASYRTRVPLPFDERAMVEWSPLWSLTGERERLLPTAYCYQGALVAGHEFVVADSNGNAAGNTIEEAILQGLLELVERDHVALWWYNRLALPGLDLASFGDPWLVRVRAHLDGEGYDVWALDLTADLAIPVVAALAAARDGAGGVAMGFGAHLDLGSALARAVTELVQLGLPPPAGEVGFGPRERLGSAKAGYLRPAARVPERRPADSALTASGDVRADLDACRARIEDRGFELMVLDQTRPDVGLVVVKVVVPGLRHFWPRFASGRLYDVPVALGHRDAPVAEADMNPQPPVP